MSNIAGSRLGNEADDEREVAEEAEGQNFRKKLIGDPVMYWCGNGRYSCDSSTRTEAPHEPCGVSGQVELGIS